MTELEKEVADLDKKIKEFSLGFRQRFGICQAIVGNPELIILDEPFNAIDEESISEISNILILASCLINALPFVCCEGKNQRIQIFALNKP